jgi:Tol biopolymer transport system component
MIEERELFEHSFRAFEPLTDPFERLASRRDRKRRNQRVAAGVVAVFLTLVVLGVVLRAIDRTPTPATPSNELTPSAANGDIAFVGANEVDFSDDVSDFRILYVVDPAGGAPTKLLAADAACPDEPSCDGAGFDSVAWSPDGTRVAFVLDGFAPVASDREGIYVLQTRTGTVRQLTSCTAPCVFQMDLTWTPDGSRIAFAQADGAGCDRANSFEGTCSLFTMRPDGTDLVQLETGSAVDPVSPSWSPDGTAVAFSARVGEHWFVYRMALDGSEPVRLAADLPSPEQTQPAWSPDGSTIAFIAWEGATSGQEPAGLDMENGMPFDVWLMTPDGSERRHLIASCCLIGGAGEPAQDPEWSPDGTQILLFGGTGGALELIDPRTGAVTTIDTRKPTGAISWQPIPRP